MPEGILGRKLGMTQINVNEERIPVTMIDTTPCLVMQKKDHKVDGYTAVKLGFIDKKDKQTVKAEKAIFDKLSAKPRRFVREFRVQQETLEKYTQGQEIKVSDVFSEGQRVDIAGTTKGRGFTGVFKRWGIGGQSRTHGTHEFFRHGGSIGCRTWPGKVHKNKRMPGHYGDARRTVQNLEIVKILSDQNVILVAGSVPGAKNSLLEIRPSHRFPRVG